MFGNHGLGGLLEEGAHEKSPKCLGWEFRGFWGILQRSPMESFFAVLKTECFYRAGELTVDELMKQIDDYMDYYNRERCSLKLKKLSPVAYRTQLAQSA